MDMSHRYSTSLHACNNIGVLVNEKLLFAELHLLPSVLREKDLVANLNRHGKGLSIDIVGSWSGLEDDAVVGSVGFVDDDS